MQKHLKPAAIYMNKKINSSLCALVMVGLCGCNNKSIEEPNPISSSVEKKIYLKEISTGMNIKEIKRIKYEKNWKGFYVFEYDYYGAKRIVTAEANAEGVIYALKIVMDENMDTLKQNLENKLSEVNEKKVEFSCNTEKIESDGSAVIKNTTCKVLATPQVLRLLKTEVQPTAKYAGLPMMPKVAISIELEDKKLKASHIEAENEIKKQKQEQVNNKKKSDI